uniref:Secreted protein n=1 Tax=Amblyomma americanum TaxID=6943 RepID=A0A0C9SES9_AMBAM
MRALLACLALFLAVAVLHCDGKRRKRTDDKEGSCTYENYEIENGGSKNLAEPCVKITCSGGETTVHKCESGSRDRKKRSAGGKKNKADKREKEETDQEKKKVFPRCCKTEE